eukprot:gnl/TRDRNA2_/TRDRNA2_38030_c0_seq1.p1 gnl/TRDRNA2_/TRDRNA2_38030_c0~~gnl/TRDRNA2_/TRDRNA2_38030_c0_seq1.p1  ORF type:complete len:626 (-),score=129.17 gnl/TRDRNA2_/TRDRNA2_38030_c0_seq1:4-1881(-)
MADKSTESSKRRGYCFGPASSGSLLTYSGARWKLWREQEAEVAAGHSDAAESYTAVCWGPPVGKAKSEKARKAVEGERADGIIALGCASGRVQVWDPRSGEAVGPTADAFHALARGSDCAVSSLAVSQTHRMSVFASCRAMPEILEVGIFDGITRATLRTGESGVVQVAASVSGAEWLLSVGPTSALKVWAVASIVAGDSTPNPHARFAGPTHVSTCIGIRSEKATGNIVALCCDGSMQVDIFSCHGEGAAGAGKQVQLAANVILSGHVRITDARFVEAEDASSTSVVGYGITAIAVWSFRLGASGGTKTVMPTMVVSSDALPGGGKVLCVRPPASGATPLVAAFGPASHPAFAEVRLPADAGGAPEVVSLAKREEAAASVAPASSATAAEKVRQAPTVLGPLEATAPASRAAQKRKLELLQVEEGEQKRRPLKDPAGAAPRGLSLAPIVRQALRAKDASSINKALLTSDTKIIESTVADLTGREAFDMLQETTLRIMSQPIRGDVLVRWVKATMLFHCSFVASQPRLREALAPLREALKERVAGHRTLVRLQGRLDLLQSAARQAKEEVYAPKVPLVEYREGDDAVGDEACDDEDDDSGEEDDGEDDSGFDLDDFDDDDFLDDD